MSEPMIWVVSILVALGLVHIWEKLWDATIGKWIIRRLTEFFRRRAE